MLKKILAAAAALVAILLGYASTKPDTFRVERSATIHASPEKIFALINDFHSWRSWSPYEHLDPQLKRTYGNVTLGKGATYNWSGNGKAGEGRMEITESTAPTKVTIQLDFTKPFQASNVAEFLLEAKGGSTTVTWAMHGPNKYLSKVMGTLFNMDKMIGSDFEVGLQNLKTATEH
jgi:uncharacterized protein YndB with AHSA1/START domain